jgi:hypothetical protein
MLVDMSHDPNAEFSDEDKTKAAELFMRLLDEFQAFANSCAARSVNAVSRVDTSEIKRKKLVAERRKLFR